MTSALLHLEPPADDLNPVPVRVQGEGQALHVSLARLLLELHAVLVLLHDLRILPPPVALPDRSLQLALRDLQGGREVEVLGDDLGLGGAGVEFAMREDASD